VSPAALASILLAAALAAAPSAPESPVAADRTVVGKPATVTVELRDGLTRKPVAGRVRLSRGEDAFAPEGAVPAGAGFFLVDGSTRLRVPAGSCRLQVDGGPTRLPYDAPLNLAPGGSEERTIFLMSPPQYGFVRAGWTPTDPFYSAGSLPADRAALAARAVGVGALGLRAPAAADPPRPPWTAAEEAGVEEPSRTHRAWCRSLERLDLPAFGWRLSPDPVLGGRGRLFTTAPAPGPRDPAGSVLATPDFGFYLDCGRPRSVNPWRDLVPWRPDLKDFYGSLREATVGLAPRMYYECLAGAPAGGFELDGSEAAERLWFALLNEGWRVPALAGSRGALSDGECPRALMLLNGGERAGQAQLVAAARAGRSTVSFGPFCFLAIDKVGPGDELPLEEGERRLLIRALASTARRAEISRVELWYNGRVAKSWDAAPGQTVAELELAMSLDEPGWVLAKCLQRVRATDELKPGPAAGPETVALTNPVWIVPRNYRASLSPVRPRVSCRLVDAATFRAVPARITVFGGEPLKPLNGLRPLGAARNPSSAPGSVLECAEGRFDAEMAAGAVLLVEAAGYQPRRITLLEELGMTAFARRLSAMPPEKAVEALSSPRTFQALRESMSRLDLEVRLQPATR